MKTLYLLIWALIICAFGQSDPCDDTRYLQLKEIPLDSMSPRQYEYFMQKEKYCHESIISSLNNNVLCTIRVEVDSLNLKGKDLPINVFVDGVSYGKPPKQVEVTQGIHTVDLFSDDGNERIKSFGIINQNNKKSRIKVKCTTQSKTLISYKFDCDNGGNSECDWDEWFFIGSIKSIDNK